MAAKSKTESAGAAAPKTTISASGGGNNSPDITYQVVRDMMNDLEKKTENRLEALESSIDAKLSRLDSVPTLLQIVYVVGGAAVAAVSLVFTIISYGGDRFDGGSQFTAYSIQQTLETKRQSDENSKHIGEISKRVETLVDLMGRKMNDSSTVKPQP